FDDLKVKYTKSKVVQSNNYYAFGLQTKDSWTRIDTKPNQYLYNAGSELNEATNNYEMIFRSYDPAIGRMSGVDPMVNNFASLTPYNYSFNDPVYWNDPSGAVPEKVTENGGNYEDCSCGGGSGMYGSPVNRVGNTIFIDWEATGEFGGTWFNDGGSGTWSSFNTMDHAFTFGYDQRSQMGMSRSEAVAALGTYARSVDGSVAHSGSVATLTTYTRYGTPHWYEKSQGYWGGNFMLGNSADFRLPNSEFMQLLDYINSRPVVRGILADNSPWNGWYFLTAFIHPEIVSARTNLISGEGGIAGAGLVITATQQALYLDSKIASGTYYTSAATQRALAASGEKAVKSFGKKFGALGVVYTLIDGAFDDSKSGLAVSAQLLIGIGSVAIPYVGWAYGVIDFGVGVYTGTSITDRVGVGIDYSKGH
ncbi:MAG: hypothetical protein KDE33_24715, partial [Bacteroidetes bacterium]|nr:hypothetical protein [Bacteroidota bacterium]